jgi:hypothetical protein
MSKVVESNIIEEKIQRKNEKTGLKESVLNKYMRGSFLGKVKIQKTYHRAVLQSVTKLQILKQKKYQLQKS